MTGHIKPRGGSVDAYVHPRVCGEQLEIIQYRQAKLGSSPRVRGTVKLAAGNSLIKRFIPACAGNSLAANRSQMATPVHPRVCGEQAVYAASVELCIGSSPRVRGTVKDHPEMIIAGAVHPRVCGEQCGRAQPR